MITNLPTTVDNYLTTISKIPLLTADQEFEFAVQYKETKDKDLAYTLVVSNLRFVSHIAKDFINYGLPLADLIQEGTIGLIKALEKFDPFSGVRLLSYAAQWIRGEIYEYIIRNWKIVKIATTKAQRKLFFNLRKNKKELKYYSLDEAKTISEKLNVDIEDVFEMEKRLTIGDVSIHPIDDEDWLAPENYLEHVGVDPLKLIEQDNSKSYEELKLYEALESLDERSQDIVKSRWLNEDKSTLDTLSMKYNISKERVRQLEQQALKKLQSLIKI